LKIKTLRLQNFRKYADSTFCFHPRFSVMIGDNGSGKTTILEALSVMLGTYHLRSKIGSSRSGIRKEEVRVAIHDKFDQVSIEEQIPSLLSAKGSLHGKPINWMRTFGDRGKDAREMISSGAEDIASARNGKDITLPVFQYYGTGRLWDSHRKTNIGKPDSRLAGYRNCFDPKSDHTLFKKWFKQLELAAIQKQKRIGALEAVRGAVKQCIPGAENFYYDISHDALMIVLEKEGYFLFDNLSDGYRNMVAMVADIAHRAARLNPHLESRAALESQGVVLIDEIDLHLHPKWQRHIVEDLKKAFPNIQFIVTTHSPFIVQSMQPGEVIDLNSIKSLEGAELIEDEIAWPGPGNVYADRSIEDIVEGIMGIKLPQRSQRYKDMYEAAKEYYRVLKSSKDAESGEKERLKQRLDELSAPFSDNVGYHAFLEMERIAAGLGKSKPEEK